MIVSESQLDDSKASIIGEEGSIVATGEPSNPPPYSSTTSNTAQQPRCNHFLEHKNSGSVKGTWHVDTSLSIPESLLPSIIDFDGHWNEDAQKVRKQKKPSPSEIRPSLMLMSSYGEVKGDVHVNGGGRAVVVAEAKNGYVNLDLNVSPEQVLQTHAWSAHGEVKVWIPSSFEGALTMGTSWGDIKISDGIKAKLTTFSSKSDCSRSFIGDWQKAGFGATDVSKSTTEDPFISWPGSTIHIGSKHGNVSIALLDEKPSSSSGSGLAGPNPFTSFFGGLFGRTRSEQGRDTSQNQSGPSNEQAPEAYPVDRKE